MTNGTGIRFLIHTEPNLLRGSKLVNFRKLFHIFYNRGKFVKNVLLISVVRRNPDFIQDMTNVFFTLLDSDNENTVDATDS